MEYHDLKQPEELTKREKEDAMGAYLMMFASIGAVLPLPIINLIAAIIYYYINKSNSHFVRFHSLQSLTSQFPTSMLNAAGVFWAAQIFLFENLEVTDAFKGYIIMVVIANLFYFIFSIMGAIKARKGQMYYFFFFGKLSYHQVYLRRAESSSENPVNIPPTA